MSQETPPATSLKDSIDAFTASMAKPHVDPDWMKRLEPTAILQALRAARA
jgi:hypothetical protein